MIILSISNTTFSEHIHQHLDLKSHMANTHVSFCFITCIPSCLCIGFHLRQLPFVSIFPDTCICLDPIQPPIVFIIIKVRVTIPSMLKDMVRIKITKVVVFHLQYEVRYFLCAVHSLEVIGTVHRNMVTGAFTIQGE